MAKARPFRLTSYEPPELAIHEACAKALTALLLPPAEWACYPAGHVKLAPAQVARLKKVGLKRGWPDLFIIYEGLVFGMEIKAHGRQLSKDRVGRSKSGSPVFYEGQESVFPKLRNAGMAIAIIHNTDEMLAQIRRWGIPLRTQLKLVT
jgi:hypothetical protein